MLHQPSLFYKFYGVHKLVTTNQYYQIAHFAKLSKKPTKYIVCFPTGEFDNLDWNAEKHTHRKRKKIEASSWYWAVNNHCGSSKSRSVETGSVHWNEFEYLRVTKSSEPILQWLETQVNAVVINVVWACWRFCSFLFEKKFCAYTKIYDCLCVCAFYRWFLAQFHSHLTSSLIYAEFHILSRFYRGDCVRKL